jgi:hypothetical protein
MNKKKYTKYSQEYFDKLKRLVPKKNITEKDDKGNVIDKPEIEILGEKRLELDSQIKTLETEIQTGHGLTQKAEDIYSAYACLKKQRKDYETHLTAATAGGSTLSAPLATQYYKSMSDNFRNGGANNYDWNAKISNQYSKNVSATVNYTDNLYQLDIGGTNYEIVEEEMVSLIAQICHGLGKITDQADFVTKFNAWDTSVANQTNMNTALTMLIAEGKLVKEGSGKSGKKTYDFASSYTKDDNTAYTANSVETIIRNFYVWLNLVKGKKNNKTLGETLTKDITHTEDVPVLGKGDAWNATKLKENFGIVINQATQTLYKPTKTAVVSYPVRGGIKGWIELGEAINDTAGGNRTKILRSFDTAPQQQLFTDLRNQICNCAGACTNSAHWNEKYKSFGDGTNVYTLDNFSTTSNHVDEIEKAENMLKHKKDVAVHKEVLSEEKIDEKKVEKNKKETERNGLDTKIQTLITTELATRRTKLATYKITDGFEDNSKVANGKDNRRTSSDLETIKDLLDDIRFLEHADTETDSTVGDENTAYTKLETLLNDFKGSKIFKFITVEGSTNADKCKKIKETSNDLQTYHDDYEKWEKLIKFTDSQKQELKDIKVALGKNEDPTESLTDYQAKLKALDPILTETIITQAIIDDWKTQTNFKTSATMEAELKKVLENGKLKDTFKAVMTKADSEITDLAKLLQKKKAKEVITMIRRWEYDQESDSAKKTKTVKVIKINMNKKKDDADPTDEEITTGLYKLAISEYSQKSESEITAWEKGDSDNNNQTPNKDKWLRANNWQVYAVFIGIPVALIVIALVIWWDSFKTWWSGNKDGTVEGEAEKSEE